MEKEVLTRILRILEQTINELQKITTELKSGVNKTSEAYIVDIKRKK